jgi:hypothetical protein
MDYSCRESFLPVTRIAHFMLPAFDRQPRQPKIEKPPTTGVVRACDFLIARKEILNFPAAGRFA